MDPQCVDYGQGAEAYISSGLTEGGINSLSARIDYQVTQGMRIFGRYADTISNVTNYGDGGTVGPYQVTNEDRTRVFLLGIDNTIGATMANQLRLQYSPVSYIESGCSLSDGRRAAVQPVPGAGHR